MKERRQLQEELVGWVAPADACWGLSPHTVPISRAGVEVAKLLPEPLPSEPLRTPLTPQTATNMTPRSEQAQGKPLLAGAWQSLCSL